MSDRLATSPADIILSEKMLPQSSREDVWVSSATVLITTAPIIFLSPNVPLGTG